MPLLMTCVFGPLRSSLVQSLRASTNAPDVFIRLDSDPPGLVVKTDLELVAETQVTSDSFKHCPENLAATMKASAQSLENVHLLITVMDRRANDGKGVSMAFAAISMAQFKFGEEMPIKLQVHEDGVPMGNLRCTVRKLAADERRGSVTQG